MSAGHDPNALFGRPIRGKEASARPARGRVCGHEGCTTVLSTYNVADLCWLHMPVAYPRKPKPE